MELQPGTRRGLIILVVSLFLVVSNPNFDGRELARPMEVLRDSGSTRGYPASGFVFLLAYAAFLASAAGLLLRYASGRFWYNDDDAPF